METEPQKALRPMEWRDLRHNASQVRKVRTNPASYKFEELDMPALGEFHD